MHLFTLIYRFFGTFEKTCGLFGTFYPRRLVPHAWGTIYIYFFERKVLDDTQKFATKMVSTCNSTQHI